MARTRKDRVFDAGAERYREFHRRRQKLAEQQRAISAAKSALNREAQDAGVHLHVLNELQRLAGIRDLEQRRVAVRLCAEMLLELEDEIASQEAAQIGHNGGPPAEEPAEAESAPVPLAERRTVAA